MDLLSARQKLVAANIANADTPGYKTQDIDFQSEFAQRDRAAASRGDRGRRGWPMKNDGNNVSLDREARLLAENAMRFNVASNLLRDRRFARCASAIQEGRAHEPVLRAFGQRLGHGRPARARRAAGREPGQRRDHPHSGRRAVPAQGRGLRERAAASRRSRPCSQRRNRRPAGRGGGRASSVDQRDPERRYLPGHPDADEDGYVAFPRINPAEDMVDLMGASRGYQANVAAMAAVKDMIHRSIDLLR